jgi:hypothetical protein
MTDFSRRYDMTRQTTVERAIVLAMRMVEEMGADVRLTRAVTLLDQARDSVADFVDGVEPPAQPAATGEVLTATEVQRRYDEKMGFVKPAATGEGEPADPVVAYERHLAIEKGRVWVQGERVEGDGYSPKPTTAAPPYKLPQGTGVTMPKIGERTWAQRVADVEAKCPRCGGSGLVMDGTVNPVACPGCGP